MKIVVDYIPGSTTQCMFNMSTTGMKCFFSENGSCSVDDHIPHHQCDYLVTYKNVERPPMIRWDDWRNSQTRSI